MEIFCFDIFCLDKKYRCASLCLISKGHRGTKLALVGFITGTHISANEGEPLVRSFLVEQDERSKPPNCQSNLALTFHKHHLS